MLTIIQIIVSVILIILLLIQTGSGGMGKTSFSKSSFTKRGLENLLFKLTFIVSFLFIFISLFQLY